MQDELRAAGLVEEALEHDRLERRQASQRAEAGAEIVDQLLGRRALEGELSRQPAERALAARVEAQAPVDVGAQARHRGRQLVAAARRLAQPERDAGRLAVRILDADGAALDSLDLVAPVAKLEDVAGQALDREVLVHAADD